MGLPFVLACAVAAASAVRARFFIESFIASVGLYLVARVRGSFESAHLELRRTSGADRDNAVVSTKRPGGLYLGTERRGSTGAGAGDGHGRLAAQTGSPCGEAARGKEGAAAAAIPLPRQLLPLGACELPLPAPCSGAPASSAGLGPDQQTSDRALAMLAYWGIDAAGHRPTKLDRRLCDKTTAIFVMAPPYLRRLLLGFGADLASKAYLYADPFASPRSLGPGQFTVPDPSFDERPAPELVEEFTWMRDQALQIRQALLGRGRPLIPAARYLNLLQSVDPTGH
jgi:protein-tyrosine-phosphatase